MSDMQNNTTTITRGDLATVAMIVAGSGLLVAGAAALQQSGFNPVTGAALGLTVLSVIAWAVLTPQEFVEFISGRQARRSVISVLSTVLIVGIVVMVYSLVEREVLTLDMTDSREFTLTPITLGVLDNVSRPIRITGFYEPRDTPLLETDDQFFRLYEVATDGLISREYIDPVAQPAIAAAYGPIGARSGDVFLSFVDEDGTINPTQARLVSLEGAQERAMTQGILSLLATGEFKVYFWLGDGALSPADVENTGIGLATEVLVQNGVSVDGLVFRELIEQGREIPQDASALVIPRPQRQLIQAEIALIDRYLDRGGGVFITADFTLNEDGFLREDSLFNQYLWENWGLRMLDAVVIDRVASDQTFTDLFPFEVFAENTITQNIIPGDPEFQTLFSVARGIEVDTTPPVTNGSAIRSSPESFAETNLVALGQSGDFQWTPTEDIQGPITTVAWARDAATDGEIILVGDSDFLTGGFIGRPLGNAVLFTDGVGWMTGFEEQVSIEPRAFAGSAPLIRITVATLDQIAFLTLLVIPGLVLLMGIGTWLYRSRR